MIPGTRAVDGEAPYYAEPRGGVIVEGRSAYVEDDSGYVYRAPAYRVVRPDYVYDEPAYRYRAPFPFSLLPWNW
jgi:hypothetical protein